MGYTKVAGYRNNNNGPINTHVQRNVYELNPYPHGVLDCYAAEGCTSYYPYPDGMTHPLTINGSFHDYLLGSGLVRRYYQDR